MVSDVQRIAGSAIERSENAETTARLASTHAKKSEESAQKYTQRLAAELRSEWRSELRAAMGSWLPTGHAASAADQSAKAVDTDKEFTPSSVGGSPYYLQH